MAVKLRLRRMGKKRQPIYKVVAADARSPRDGKFIESIGLYNPKSEPATIEINAERALYWLGVGAQPTITVNNLLSKSGVNLRRNLLKKGVAEDEINAQVEAWLNKNEVKKPAAKKAEKKEEVKAEVTEEPKAEKVEAEVTEEPKAEIEEPEVKGTASESEQTEDKV